MLRIGICGFSEGNGHPFSFSAILNGFSDEGFKASGWKVIHDYLRERDPNEIGTLGARATHVWTPDPALSKTIADASLIGTVVHEPEDLVSEVDAVMILRDDHESHFTLAQLFLEAGLPVFVDKPLSLDPHQLRHLQPALEAGQLFSVSGLRFAKELDGLRGAFENGFKPILYRAAVVNDWMRYGVHMIDVLFGLTAARPIAVTGLTAQHEAFALELDDGGLFEVDCLGSVPKIFRFECFARERHTALDLHDNFSAFRRTIARFLEMVTTGRPPIPPDDTMVCMKTLIAGLRSRSENRRVEIGEVRM